jgi:hypothetical protein
LRVRAAADDRGCGREPPATIGVARASEHAPAIGATLRFVRDSELPFQQLIGTRVGETEVENVHVHTRRLSERERTLIITLYLVPPEDGSPRWPASDLWELRRSVREIINAQVNEPDMVIASDIRFAPGAPRGEEDDFQERTPTGRPHLDLLITPDQPIEEDEDPDGDPNDAA